MCQNSIQKRLLEDKKNILDNIIQNTQNTQSTGLIVTSGVKPEAERVRP